MSVIGAIDSLSTGTYAVTRPGVITTLKGRPVTATSSTFSIVAVMEPASGRDLKVLPEGRDVEDARKVVTYVELRLGDLVLIDSLQFECYHVDGPWTVGGGTHWNAIVAAPPTVLP